MNLTEIHKVLSNPVRQHILQWLKSPDENFPPHKELGHFVYGVCQHYIQEKAKLSQSTISQYMSQLQRAGLVDATRIGKWTYFKRNEEVIQAFISQLKKEI